MKKRFFNFMSLWKIIPLAVILCLAASIAMADEWGMAPDSEYTIVDKLFKEDFESKTSELVKIKTFRGGALNEDEVITNLEEVRNKIKGWADEFNRELKTLKLEFFEWKSKKTNNNGSKYWLFGFRLGNGKHKAAIITHLDTVPPGNDAWKPFETKEERRDYMGTTTAFLKGRGALDDKGPSIVAFAALKALAQKFDGTDKLKDFTMEVIFDTSEETDMAMPHYLKDNDKNKPELGVVYDAMWCVAYEKGIERPIYSAPLGQTIKNHLWIDDFNTFEGPSNQIADSATAVIKAANVNKAKKFAEKVEQMYNEYGFDDPLYRKAKLTIESENRTVTLTTHVSGAQHGSAPQENREKGANPLVSLGDFLAHLVDSKELNSSGIGQMLRFMAWGWGTHVFGEDHPGLLEGHDSIFKKGNGTTYALTKFVTDKIDKKATLQMDIRYALPHHGYIWDQSTWGTLLGDSKFKNIFAKLVSEFNKTHQGPQIDVNTSTAAGPDLKNPKSPEFLKVSKAFKDVTGEDCPCLAIGGGTDAKGYAELIAAGSLFTESLGPPVNFHGINEGAPIEDLRKGSRILYRILLDEVE